MEKKLLEVGDVVYCLEIATGDIKRLEIIRTTKLLACYDNYVHGDRLRKEVVDGKVEVYGYHSPHIQYLLPTMELHKKWCEKKSRLKISQLIEDEIELKKLSLPQLLSIKKTLTLPDEDLAIWIKVEDLDKDNLPAGTYIGINGEFYVGYIELEGGEVSLVYNNGESIMYPTHIISTLALLHIPNHPLPTQKPQKEEDAVEWIKVEDLDRNNLPEGVFVGYEDEDGVDTEVGRLSKVESKTNGVYDVCLYFDDGCNAIYPTHIIPLSQLLKLPTKPSTK